MPLFAYPLQIFFLSFNFSIKLKGRLAAILVPLKAIDTIHLP
jgi:hypothetical protein